MTSTWPWSRPNGSSSRTNGKKKAPWSYPSALRAMWWCARSSPTRSLSSRSFSSKTFHQYRTLSTTRHRTTGMLMTPTSGCRASWCRRQIQSALATSNEHSNESWCRCGHCVSVYLMILRKSEILFPLQTPMTMTPWTAHVRHVYANINFAGTSWCIYTHIHSHVRAHPYAHAHALTYVIGRGPSTLV